MRKHILLAAPWGSLALFGAVQAESPAFPPERFRGHEISARYVASQFEAAGLEPGGRP